MSVENLWNSRLIPPFQNTDYPSTFFTHDNWVAGEDGKLIMQIPKHLHAYLYRPRNITILNLSFFVKIHFGTRQNIFVSYFHFLTLSFLCRLVSYLFIPVMFKLDLFMIVIIPMYHAFWKRVSILSVCHVYVYISLTNAIRKEPSSGGRVLGSRCLEKHILSRYSVSFFNILYNPPA